MAEALVLKIRPPLVMKDTQQKHISKIQIHTVITTEPCN